MRNGQINSLSEIDMERLSFEDIRWRYGVFHPTSTGAGRDKQYSAWIGVQTSLGEIEKGVWYQAAEALIQKAGEQKLLEALTDWESRHNYAKDSARTVRHKALQLHISRIFDNPRWVNFIPFNREYRPEVLEHANLVTVINECCGKPGEVTQEQIDPYPVNLYATEKFIFMAYSDYVSLIEYDDREPDNQFSPINENFVIDRKTGKVFSMGDLERFTVCGENIVRCSQYGVTGFVYYYLSVENGALIFTDLMPNKNIFVREVFEDAFGNVYVYNESVSKKEGNIVYVTDRVRIGEDGYAYLFRDTLSFNSIDEDTFSDNRYTVKRYGRDGFLQEEWNPVETVVRFPTDSYSEEGYVALLGSEIFVIGADGSGKICRWWGSQEGGEAGTYTAMAYLPFGTAYPLSPRMAVAIRDDGQVWYYDLLSSKNLTDYYGDDITVETFENQGFIMQGNSIVYKDGSVFVHVEDTQGTQVYKLELTAGANGLPAVTAVLHQENEYNAAVLIFLPLN